MPAKLTAGKFKQGGLELRKFLVCDGKCLG
jgi:hypothetical protein